MSRRINNTSGGLFAAFSPKKELNKDSKSAVETQIVVSGKKGNSRAGKIKATVTDSLALIQVPTDGQIKQPTLSKKRGRSRPRKIKPNEEKRSKANRNETECSIPTKVCRVLPRRNRYNPPRVLHKSFKAATMSRPSNPQSNFVSDTSTSFEGSIRAKKTTDTEVLKTPSKRSKSDALDTQKNAKSKLVTPSPKVKRKKSSNTSYQSSDISVSSKGRNNKVRRVSSVNGAAKKKKRVELAKAVSVGKVTIPAREVEKSTRKTNNGKIIKATQSDIKSLALTETNKSYQMSKVQREAHGLAEFTTKSFEGYESSRRDQLSTGNFEGHTKDKDLAIHRRMNSSKSKDSQPKWVSLKRSRNGKKSKFMSFIDDAIDDLKELKNEIKRIPVSDLVKIEELRRMYKPLTRKHLLVDNQLKNKVKTKSSVQTFGFMAPKTNYSTRTPFPLLNNSCKDHDEDSCCDSVIDFGIISDSKAIVAYSQQDDVEDCQSKSSLKNKKAKESRSRIQSNSVGILASLSAPPTQETSVVATLATRNIKERRDKSSSKRESRIGLVHTSKNDKTEKETRVMPEKEQVDSQQLNQFQELFAMNHDELLGIEMNSRLDKLSQKNQRKKKGKIFPNRDASKDDLFDMPAIAF